MGITSLLIVEESLRDLKAHWFEYIQTIVDTANEQNVEVEVACHKDVDIEISQILPTIPVFSYARYLDNNKKKLLGERYYSFILHSFRCIKVLWPLFNSKDSYDYVFAPTVLVHHLLAWWIILKFHPRKPQHLTLFFVTNPGVWNSETKTSFFPKQTQIQKKLLQGFSPFVAENKITLAVETLGAKKEFEALTGLPFSLMPHPVPEFENLTTSQNSEDVSQRQLCFACYGFARYEKGSDLLALSIEKLLNKLPSFPVNFRIQWTDPFLMPDSTLCQPSEYLLNNSQITIIDKPLNREEYQQLLKSTDCMILPYRNSSYYARLSRIAIESICLGIPIIYTKGGWLEEVVLKFGSGIPIEDENIDELTQAIQDLFENYQQYRKNALKNTLKAKKYFSGQNFCSQLLNLN